MMQPSFCSLDLAHDQIKVGGRKMEQDTAQFLSTLIGFLLIVGIAALNVHLAFKYDKQYRETDPASTPVKWFYFLGLTWAWSAALVLIASVGVLEPVFWFITLLLSGLLLTVVWFYLKRRKWAFITLTILSNLIIFFAHWFYYKNRVSFFV